MENCQIVLIEDDPLVQKFFSDVVLPAGHEIVAQADNLPDAELLVDRIAEGELRADVVVLDGRFPNAGDGAVIAKQLRKYGVGAAVVGWSSSRSRDTFGGAVNVELEKHCRAAAILQALADLPEPGRFRNGECTDM